MATCKGCGMQACTWDKQGGKLRFLEPSGERHRCLFYRVKNPEYTGPMTKQGATITGKDFHPTCLGCPGLPWQKCCGQALATSAERANKEADERWEYLLDLWAQP